MTPLEKILAKMETLSNVERAVIISEIGEHYCLNCGADHYGKRQCQCWNDE